MTARPWPEGTAPTAAQLLEWLRDPDALDRADDDGDRLLVLDRLLTAAERAERCVLMDHDGDQARANALVSDLAGQLLRYRLAWMSARRRALDPNHAADVLEALVLTAEEDPDATP